LYGIVGIVIGSSWDDSWILMEYLSQFPSDSSGIPVLSISPGFPKLAAWSGSETMWSQSSGVLVEKKQLEYPLVN